MLHSRVEKSLQCGDKVGGGGEPYVRSNIDPIHKRVRSNYSCAMQPYLAELSRLQEECLCDAGAFLAFGDEDKLFLVKVNMFDGAPCILAHELTTSVEIDAGRRHPNL